MWVSKASEPLMLSQSGKMYVCGNGIRQNSCSLGKERYPSTPEKFTTKFKQILIHGGLHRFLFMIGGGAGMTHKTFHQRSPSIAQEANRMLPRLSGWKFKARCYLPINRLWKKETLRNKMFGLNLLIPLTWGLPGWALACKSGPHGSPSNRLRTAWGLAPEKSPILVCERFIGWAESGSSPLSNTCQRGEYSLDTKPIRSWLICYSLLLKLPTDIQTTLLSVCVCMLCLGGSWREARKTIKSVEAIFQFLFISPHSVSSSPYCWAL